MGSSVNTMAGAGEVVGLLSGPAANKAIVNRFFDEVCNGRQLAVADELFTADHAYHDPSIPGVARGPEGIRQNPGPVVPYQQAFSDARWVVEEMVAEGDYVVTRWTGHGTQDGDLPGIPAQGRRVLVPGVWVQRLADGKITESWQVWDTFGMLRQLGAIPSPEEAANMARVGAIYAAFGRGDIPTLLAALAEDVLWEAPGPAAMPYFGTRRSREAVGAEVFNFVGEHFAFTGFEPRTFFAKGDQVVVLLHVELTMKRNGRAVAQDWVHVFTFRDGLVSRLQDFQDSAAMLAAWQEAAA